MEKKNTKTTKSLPCAELLKAYRKSEKEIARLKSSVKELKEDYVRKDLQVEEYRKMCAQKEQHINDGRKKLGEERIRYEAIIADLQESKVKRYLRRVSKWVSGFADRLK